MTKEDYLNLVGKTIWPQLLLSLLLIFIPADGCKMGHLTGVEVNISTTASHTKKRYAYRCLPIDTPIKVAEIFTE